MPHLPPYEVTVRPQHTPRSALEPLPGSRWLAKKAPTAKWAPLYGVLVLATLPVPALAVLLALGGGLAIAGYAHAHAERQRTQYCPRCLAGMGRGATRCPWCHVNEAAL
jgi:ribosomal protein L40E